MIFTIDSDGGRIGPFVWANSIVNTDDIQLLSGCEYLSFDGWFRLIFDDKSAWSIGGGTTLREPRRKA